MAQITISADPTEIHAVEDAPWTTGEDAPVASTAIAAITAFPVADPALRQAFWKLYDAESEDVLLKKRILIFTITLRLKHLHFLFVLLFGPHP